MSRGEKQNKSGRPRSIAENEEFLVVQAVWCARESLRCEREHLAREQYFDRFEANDAVREGFDRIKKWPADRRRAALRGDPNLCPDAEELAFIREMNSERSDVAKRPLGGMHSIKVSRYGVRQQEFEIAARSLSVRFGRTITSRAVERVWKKWRSRERADGTVGDRDS